MPVQVAAVNRNLAVARQVLQKVVELKLLVLLLPHLALNESYPPLTLLKERRHGDSFIAIYQKEGES